MLWTILIYSLFTGLSALSVGFWDFAFYRFLTGLGVGGEFAVGVSLVAEVMPDRARALCAGPAAGAVGRRQYQRGVDQPGAGQNRKLWRLGIVELRGRAAARLANDVRRGYRARIAGDFDSPPLERARALAGRGRRGWRPHAKLGSYAELFGDPRWRRNAIVGMCMAFSGVVGLWGIGFFSVDLFRRVFTQTVSSRRACRRPKSPAKSRSGSA